VQQAERAADVLIHLRDFVRPGPSRRHFVAVRPLIDIAVGLAMIEAMQTKVEITVHADPGLPLVFADNIQIEQVLLNLLRNAIDAMVTAEVTQRRIVVNARRKDAGSVEISVADTGPGISDELREIILEPFVTTKPRGMGMGLSISRSIVEAHGGSLRSLRSNGSGAIFAFDLPVHDIEGNVHAG
jgi:two-component system, LuxR family, sensor kinase FixL